MKNSFAGSSLSYKLLLKKRWGRRRRKKVMNGRSGKGRGKEQAHSLQ